MTGAMTAPDTDRPRLLVLDWTRIDKGALLGKARIRRTCQLEIADVAIFEKDDRRWAQLPAEMMRDMTGQPLKDERGKAKYRSSLKWATRELQDGFSEAVIAAIEAEHGPLGRAVAA
jgi:hypothetical protein